MAKIYFTVAGTNHYFGQDFFKPGMKVKLIKEPDNTYDKEAIRVELAGLGTVRICGEQPVHGPGRKHERRTAL